MILSIVNTSIMICIPIYHMQQNEPFDILLLVRDLIYLLLLLITAYVQYNYIVIYWNVRKFHHNMNVSMCFTFGTWFEVFVAALLTWPYKSGYFGINETGDTFDGLESAETTEVTRLYSTIPLFIGSFLFWHQLATNIAGFSLFVFERGIASFLFSDYEKHNRSYISILLLVVSQFFIIIIIILFVLQFIALKSCVIMCVVNFWITLILLAYLVYYNVKIRNRLDLNSATLSYSYSLAARFQADENVRSIKLATGILIVIAITTIITCIMLTIVNFKLATQEVDRAIYWLFETLSTLNPLIVVPVSLYTIPEWRYAFFHRLPFFRERVHPTIKTVEVRRRSVEADFTMILSIVNTSIIIFVPIFHMRQNETIESFPFVRECIYFLLLIITAYISYHHVLLIWTIRKFHHNLTVLSCFTFGAWVEVPVSVLLIWPYRAGLISINDTGETFDGLETVEKTLVTRVNSTIPLLIGSFLFWHHVATNTGAITLFALERGVASFMFSDYEKHKRSCISTLFLVGSQTTIIMLMALLTLHFIDLQTAIILCGINFVFTFFILIYILYYNVKIRNKLDLKSSEFYSLAARFQAAENIRCFKLAAGIVVVVGISTIVTCIMLTIVNFHIFSLKVNHAIYWLFETMATLNPLIVVPVVFYSIPEWRFAFYRKLPFFRKRVHPTTKIAEVRRISIETNVYFEQLRASWN